MNTETEYDYPKPASDFPYSMKTTSIMEHSRGIAWTADLITAGKVVGTIEQMGDGGADRVSIFDTVERALWHTRVSEAFGGDEEGACFYLLCKEEEG